MASPLDICVVGSVALDDVETPAGKADNAVGGAAVYFSLSASYFTKVRLVGVAGRDFPRQTIALLRKRKVDLEGLDITSGSTFRWRGSYLKDLNQAETLQTELNVFETFQPKLPESYRDAKIVFLANINPELQLDVLRQVRSPRFVAMDTMNLWIDIARPTLEKALKKVDLICINEGEARQLSGESQLPLAAQRILKMGPGAVVIKRGEYGANLFTKDRTFFAQPAYPLEIVRDPTGAGDSFAGGLIGSLAKERSFSDAALKRALVWGSVMGSFVVEQFSIGGTARIPPAKLRRRFADFARFTRL